MEKLNYKDLVEADKYMDLTQALEHHFSLHDTDMIFNVLMKFLDRTAELSEEITFDDFLNTKVNHIVPIGESDIEEFNKLLDNRRHPFTWTFGNCDLEFVSQWKLCVDCVEEHPMEGSDLCKDCIDMPQILKEDE